MQWNDICHKDVELISYIFLVFWDIYGQARLFSIILSWWFNPVCLYLYPPNNEVVGGYIGFTLSVCPSVCPSVRPSVRPACRVRSVTSTVLDGFFSYQSHMITTMRGCVAHNDLWPWPISSRSFGLDLENRVRSVVSTVLVGFFLY